MTYAPSHIDIGATVLSPVSCQVPVLRKGAVNIHHKRGIMERKTLLYCQNCRMRGPKVGVRPDSQSNCNVSIQHLLASPKFQS
jgi:hypothetical protein